MDDDRKRTSFTLGDLQKSQAQFRDKDNAKPTIPPPRSITLSHPRLAPPGMSGIKKTKAFSLDGPKPPPPEKTRVTPGKEGVARKEFKSLAPPSPTKSIDRSR